MVPQGQYLNLCSCSLAQVLVPQFTQEQAVSTTRQSTTMSPMENAIYTIMEVVLVYSW